MLYKNIYIMGVYTGQYTLRLGQNISFPLSE